MKWACGVRTVERRIRNGLLSDTLRSVAAAGFPQYRVFVDGEADIPGWLQPNLGGVFYGLPGNHGAFVLSISCLYFQHPRADAYVVFEDDVKVAEGLREYLEQVTWPEKAYLNLWSVGHNEKGEGGFHVVKRKRPGKGAGALGFVLPRQAMLDFLSAKRWLTPNKKRGKVHWRGPDTTLASTLEPLGWTEFVHIPSLVFHTGAGASTVYAEGRKRQPRQRQTITFTGRTW